MPSHHRGRFGLASRHDLDFMGAGRATRALLGRGRTHERSCWTAPGVVAVTDRQSPDPPVERRPTVDLLCAASGAERRRFALERLGRSSPTVVVTPRRSASDELVWDLAHAGHPTAAVERTTPTLLAAELASWALAQEGRVAVGEVAGRAVLARVVDRVLGEGRLRWFAEVAQLPGFVPSLQRTIQELRMAGIPGADLQRLGTVASESTTPQPTRAAHLRLLRGGGRGVARFASVEGTMERRDLVFTELGALCLAYEDELADWGLADRAWHLARAIEVAAGHAPVAAEVRERLLSPWRGRDQLWLDVALHSPLEREFFRAMTQLAPGVTVAIPARDRQTIDAVGELESDDFSVRVVEVAAPTVTSGLSRVQQTIFATALEPADDSAADGDESFTFFSAAGEGQEAVEIARRALELAGDGVPFDDMAILLRQPNSVLPLVEDALGRAGIPAYFARGNTRPDPSGRALLALLNCAAEGLSATAFAEYLSFDQVPAEEDPENPPRRSEAETDAVPWVAPVGEQLVLKSLVVAGETSEEEPGPLVTSRAVVGAEPPVETTRRVRSAPGRWEKILVDAAVVGGADRWRRRLRGRRAELERKLEEAREDAEGRRRGLSAECRNLEDLERIALPILDLLERLPEGGLWGTWLDHLERLAVRSLRWPRSVLEVLAQLRPMSSVEGVSLRQVQRTLDESLRDLETKPPKRRQGRIFVGAIDQARGRSFRVVFLPGLAEGVFPARANEDPLLLDRERQRIGRALATVDVGSGEAVATDTAREPFDLLLVQATRLHRERLLLRLALGAASERLLVSYPRIDTMLGRARVPSFYALDVLRAAEGRLPDLASLALRAASGGAAGVSWPAPETPEQAIDDAEFDLALLHPSQKESGAARFLLFANEHLARSLHARARRWRRPFTWADGLVLDDGPAATRSESLRVLADQRPGARSYSPTALQHFSACPYRFLLQAIHRLRAEEDRTGLEQLDPLTRGSLFHEIQFVLFRRLRDEGRLPIRDDHLADIIDLADEVLDEVAARTYEEIAPAIDRIWKAEIDSLRNDLRGWLRLVAESPGWQPVMAELSFGLPLDGDHDEASVKDPVEVGGYLFRGSIDLVERYVGPGDAPTFRVTDHKTGRASAKQGMVIAGGTVLQPTIYALVLERMLRDGQVPSTVGNTDEDGFQVQSGRLDYCTVKGGFQTVDVPLNPEARNAVEEVLGQVDASVRDGFLPAAPQEGACRYCDYRAVCGPYEERRIQRKRQEPLADLMALRRRR